MSEYKNKYNSGDIVKTSVTGEGWKIVRTVIPPSEPYSTAKYELNSGEVVDEMDVVDVMEALPD